MPSPISQHLPPSAAWRALPAWSGLLALLALLALTVLPATTQARRRRGAGSDQRLLKRAITLYHTGQLKASLMLLKRAKMEHDVAELDSGARNERRLGRILLYRGLNLALMGQRAQARVAFKAALAEYPILSLSPHRFKPELVKLFNQVRKKSTSRLVVTCTTSGAVILVDSKPRGEAPVELYLAPGPHRVQARNAAGKIGFTKEVNLVLGKSVRVLARLGARPARKRASGHKAVGDAPPPKRFRKVWTLVMAGTSLALVITGAALWASSESSFSELEEQYPELLRRGELTAIEELKESIDGKDTAATVMFALAGASAAAAVALFFLEGRTSGEAPRDSISPWSLRIVPSGAGLGLVTRF
jgi:tetratricopeptide (TPR) repeat protein